MKRAQRTCCTTHADNCRFGRDHAWHGPFLLNRGKPVDGAVWSHDADLHCVTCGGVCYGDRAADEFPPQHVGQEVEK